MLCSRRSPHQPASRAVARPPTGPSSGTSPWRTAPEPRASPARPAASPRPPALQAAPRLGALTRSHRSARRQELQLATDRRPTDPHLPCHAGSWSRRSSSRATVTEATSTARACWLLPLTHQCAFATDHCEMIGIYLTHVLRSI